MLDAVEEDPEGSWRSSTFFLLRARQVFLGHFYMHEGIECLYWNFSRGIKAMTEAISSTSSVKYYTGHVCFVFERARVPRHFLLGQGHSMRIL